MQFVSELKNRRASAYYQQQNDNLVIFENSIVTKKLYIKLLRIQMFILILHIFALLNGFLIFDSAKVHEFNPIIIGSSQIGYSLLNILLICQSVASLVQIVMIFVQQYFSYVNEQKRGLNVGSFFGRITDSWKSILLSAIIELMHPNILWERFNLWNAGNTFSMGNISYLGIQYPQTYSMNDLCCLIQFFRIVFVFYLVMGRLEYNSDSSYRIWLA